VIKQLARGMRSGWTARHEDGSMSIRAYRPHLGCPSEQLIAALLPDVTAPRPAPRPVSLPSLPVLSLSSIDDPDMLPPPPNGRLDDTS
jgi:hypothetical protein